MNINHITIDTSQGEEREPVEAWFAARWGTPMLELVVELDRESHERVRQKCWQRKPAIHTCNDRA
jgi:hypothetical protein